jgi:16S rRNA (guanine966-N2)-methyltransferase
MRIIAGKYRSRRLQSLPGLDLRPTADRLRETLFDILAAGNPTALSGSVWLDLYAGTGAVGIEALSRGATTVYFVDSSSRVAELIKKNLRSLGIEGEAQILEADVIRAVRQLKDAGAVADFVFLDPPYRFEDTYRETLVAISQSAILKTTGVVIAEHHRKLELEQKFGPLTRYRTLIQGDAALSFYRR